jgi:methyltransferase (TIGR00027 family)
MISSTGLPEPFSCQCRRTPSLVAEGVIVSVQIVLHAWAARSNQSGEATHALKVNRKVRDRRAVNHEISSSVMKATRSSTTAEQMALSRAIETRKPAGERICCDPLAERFLGAKYRMLLWGRPFRDLVERTIERRFAGHHYYVIARTCYFDDFVQEYLTRGADQLVILGAGYDSRPYRFADRLSGVQVFEVDHPATSTAKQAKVREILGDIPANVAYVAVDFTVDNFADKLVACGYRATRPTVFLWEGVTPYLDLAAVDAVLGFVTNSAGAGSAILFDYILRSVVEGTCTLGGAANEFAKMSHTSEPLSFGIDEGQAPAFLASRGFQNVVEVGAQELTSRYFDPHGKHCYIKPWWRMISGEVGAVGGLSGATYGAR